MKKLLLVVVVLGVVAIASIYLLYSNLDAVVKTAIETYGSEILGTDVRVKAVKLSLPDGKASILGLRVRNPESFGSDDAFSLAEITVQIDPQSVTSEPLRLPEVKIVAPSVAYILDERGGSNLDALLANVNRSSSSAPAEPAEAGGKPLLIAIDRFAFEEGKVAADLSALGGGKLDAKLAPVRLSKLGGSKGATPQELGIAIAQEFLASATKAVAAKQASKLLGDAFPKDVADAIGKEGGEAVKILGGFMKKK